MYLHKQKKKNGDTYLSIKEKYHVPKVGSRETTVERIGYLSKLKNTPFLLRNLRFKNVKNFYQYQIMRSEKQIKINQGPEKRNTINYIERFLLQWYAFL